MASLSDFPALPERKEGETLIYVVVGEPSGDQLASHLVRALKEATGGSVAFRGLAGARMRAEGIESVFPISELALMGLEVLPHAGRLLKRIQMVADDILAVRPDAVVMVDAQSFSARVATKVAGQGIPLIQYVAPTVWAWKPSRARKISAYLDRLLTIFPFEAPYFEKHGLETTFVGHPAAEATPPGPEAGPRFRKRHGIAGDAPLLCVLPGSRRGEVRRHMSMFRDVAGHLGTLLPGLECALPTVPNVAELVAEGAKDWPTRLTITDDPVTKYDLFAAANVALAVSGTVTVETSFARLPTVVAYRAPWVTATIGRFLILTKYASGTNIVLDRPVLPEFIQENCTREKLTKAVHTLFVDQAMRQSQLAGIDEAVALLQVAGKRPSAIAAEAIIDEITRFPKGRRA